MTTDKQTDSQQIKEGMNSHQMNFIFTILYGTMKNKLL